MFKFGEYFLITENFNQLKALVKSHGDIAVDNGYGTPTGVKKGSDDYELLATMISPDTKHTQSVKNEIYGDIDVNPDKERVMRPFLGMLGKMYYDEECGLDVIRFITDYILSNKQTLNKLIIKNNNTNETYNLTNLLDIFKYKTIINDGRPAYEILTDAIRDKGGVDKVKEWINKMPSLLKNTFKDQDNYKELSNLINDFETIPKEGKDSILISLFGNGERRGKISRFKSAEEFLKALKVDIGNYKEDYNIDKIKQEILNTKYATLIICDYEKAYIVADIMDYSASNKLGEPNNWCISYGDNYWYNTYMNYKTKNKMFFIFNFNEDSSNKYSKMGLCIEEDGDMRAFHDKYDNSIKLDVLYKYDINTNFTNIKVTDEEFKIEEKLYMRWSVLKDPFNGNIEDLEEAYKICDTIIKLYNDNELDELKIVDIWNNIFYIRTDVRTNVIEYLLEKCDFKPIKIWNNILGNYINTINFNGTLNSNNATPTEPINDSIIIKLFNLYNINVSHDINIEIFPYLYDNIRHVYDAILENVNINLKKKIDIYSGILMYFIKDLVGDKTYNILLDYIINKKDIHTFIIEIFKYKNIIEDLIKRNYLFNSGDIRKFLQIYDCDLSKIKINEKDLLNLLDICIDRDDELKNIENLHNLCKANNIDLYTADNDLSKLKFLVNNGVSLDDIKWNLIVSEDNGYRIINFLEDNESVNIYNEFKKGNIKIFQKGFYYENIIKYIFENDLKIEDSDMFIESLKNQRNYKIIPLKYIHEIINLFIRFKYKIPSEIAEMALKNNILVDTVIDNLDYSEEFDYKSGNTDILEDLFSYDNPYIDIIIAKIPNLKKYDMSQVGIYIKNVNIINKLLDICEKPEEELMYNILRYCYKTDSEIGDVGDNEQTLELINRLINMKYEFNFENSSFFDFYFIFSDLSLFMLKNILDKKYFKFLKLNKEKVARKVLEQNNFETYLYFKNKGIIFKINYLPSKSEKDIIEDILKTDTDIYEIFLHISNYSDFIYFYDKYYDKLTDNEKQRIINRLLSPSYYRISPEDIINILNHIVKYPENKQFIEENWEENKRRKIYSDETRNWIKNYLNPPKVRVKKIREMFDIDVIPYIRFQK